MRSRSLSSFGFECSTTAIKCQNARENSQVCDLWITDLTEHITDGGMQLVMFTYQDLSLQEGLNYLKIEVPKGYDIKYFSNQ
jgi:c-di-GMP-binding flagellar brake protein YcgR